MSSFGPCFKTLCMQPEGEPDSSEGSPTESSFVSSQSEISRHLFSVQNQVRDLQRTAGHHQRTLDSLEVQGSDHSNSLTAGLFAFILLLQLVRFLSDLCQSLPPLHSS